MRRLGHSAKCAKQPNAKWSSRLFAGRVEKISRAAEELGISRPTLYELIEKLGLGKPVEEKE